MTRDETTNEEKSSRSYWGFVLWPLAVFVFYALSVGPAAMAVEKRFISWRCLRVYAPLARAVHHTPFERPYLSYLHFWAPRTFGKDGEMVW